MILIGMYFFSILQLLYQLFIPFAQDFTAHVIVTHPVSRLAPVSVFALSSDTPVVNFRPVTMLIAILE